MRDRVYRIDKWSNRKNFIERSLLYSQTCGTKFIEDFWCTVHTVRNQFFEKFNLLTSLKLDSKSYLLELQSKTNIHQTNGHQLTRLSKQEKAWQKTGTKKKWVGDGVVTELHRSVGGLTSQTVQGISYNNWGYIQKKNSSIHKTSVDYRWTPKAWLWQYDINMLHQQCDFNVSQSVNCSMVSADEIIWQMARSTCDWMQTICPIFPKARA